MEKTKKLIATKKILIYIVIAEVIGLMGIFFLRYQYDKFYEQYNRTISSSYYIKSLTAEISENSYKHENLLLNYVRASTVEGNVYFEEAKDVVQEIKKLLASLGTQTSKTSMETLFHEVNDNLIIYIDNSSTLFLLSNQGATHAAKFYLDTNMLPLLSKVNSSIFKINDLAEETLSTSTTKLDRSALYTRVVSIVSMIFMILLIILSSIFAFNTLKGLESKKNLLEDDVETKKNRIYAMQNKIIIGIADLIENRSGETGQHVKRTSNLVGKIVKKAKEDGMWPDIIDDNYVDNIIKAAPLHDIGKIVVSDTILNKPGKLDDEEFAQMKLHAAEGGRIIKELIHGIEEEDYIEMSYNISTYHHEKWNGKGYPFGLAGEDIPLCARIMAVADVFDALVSERCYKKAMSYEDAFKIIEKDAGSHFDPDVARIFLELRPEIEAEKDK